MHSLSVFKVSHAFWCCFMYVFFKVVSVWECTLITLFISLCGVFTAAWAFPWLWCEGVPSWWALLLQSWLGAWTAVTAVCGLSCSTRLYSSGPVVAAHRLSRLRHVGSSWTWDQTHVSYIGRKTLYLWANMEAPRNTLFFYIDFCAQNVSEL